MFSNVLIAFLVSVGATAWIYNKFMRSTGGNTKNSVVSAAVAGAAIFIFMLLALMFIGNWLSN